MRDGLKRVTTLHIAKLICLSATECPLVARSGLFDMCGITSAHEGKADIPSKGSRMLNRERDGSLCYLGRYL